MSDPMLKYPTWADWLRHTEFTEREVNEKTGLVYYTYHWNDEIPEWLAEKLGYEKRDIYCDQE